MEDDQNHCDDFKEVCSESMKYTAAQCDKLFSECPINYNMEKGICGKSMQNLADSGLSDEEFVFVFVDCIVKKGWGLFGGSFVHFFKKSD